LRDRLPILPWPATETAWFQVCGIKPKGAGKKLFPRLPVNRTIRAFPSMVSGVYSNGHQIR